MVQQVILVLPERAVVVRMVMVALVVMAGQLHRVVIHPVLEVDFLRMVVPVLVAEVVVNLS